MTNDEKNLTRRFRAGEAGSFEALYREYGPRIYRFSRRLCGNEADAEDLTQEVFLAAYQGADRFQARSSLTTWLYRIALYRWRRTRSVRRPETVPLDGARAALSSDPAQAGLVRLSLDNALAALPDMAREAFLLVKGEGLLCREAAEVLGIPEGTLKSRVYTAVAQLQRRLEAEAEDDTVKRSGVRMEEMRYESGRWATDAILWFDYDAPVPGALFDPAAAKAERRAPFGGMVSAQELYRMTDAQHAKYTTLIGGMNAQLAKVKADASLLPQEKDRKREQISKTFMAQAREIMNPDQQKLWDDWGAAQSEMLNKLLNTPQQRKEDAEWKAQQQRLFDEWANAQDDRTKQMLKGGQ